MDKKVIAIAVLAILFLCQTCSKCSSNRKAQFYEQNTTYQLDSINDVKNELFLYSKDLEKQIEILKKDNFDLKTRNEMLVENIKSLKLDKANLNADKKTLNKIINEK